MILNQKEIILLQFPFTNFEQTKVRPAIVISNTLFNKKSDDCVVVPLTTVIKEEPYSILINQDDLDSGKLLKPSRIRADKIFTIDKKMIIMKIGIINDTILEKIKRELSKIF